MKDDIDAARRTYATLRGSIDDALALLEWGDVWGVKANLQIALEAAEELYTAGERAAGELAELREKECRKGKP